MTHLKQRLRFGAQDGFILRREKATLGKVLPAKHDLVLHCELSPKQRQQHLELVRAERDARGESRMRFIWEIMRLHQHPALVPRYQPILTQAAIAECPKLAAAIETLDKIGRRSEKALIFTRHLDMQQLLAETISDHFGTSIDIVNGATSLPPFGEEPQKRVMRSSSDFAESLGSEKDCFGAYSRIP